MTSKHSAFLLKNLFNLAIKAGTFTFMATASIVLLFLATFAFLCEASSPFGPNISQYAVAKLPSVNYKLPSSWAGSIGVPSTKDDSLFFWLFQAEDRKYEGNLIIWLNGGPGCSSMGGLTMENGPLVFVGNSSIPIANPYSWTKLANVLYIDQPVGTGYSTGSDPALSNEQVTKQFHEWLQAFYAQFPGLKARETYLMGESYAGIYIPYFTQAILQNSKSLNINLRSITLGDPTIGNGAAMTDVVATSWIHQHNSLLNLPPDILSVFDKADVQCGFSSVFKNLIYPPVGNAVIPGDPEDVNYRMKRRQDSLGDNTECQVLSNPVTVAQVNESIYGPCFGSCATWTTAANYLNNSILCFDIYNVNYTCESPNPALPTEYLNRPDVRAAIHAPRKTAVACNETVQMILGVENVEPPAYSILSDIIDHGIKIHIYSGDNDFLLNHMGTEIVIQNMSWSGKQGFQCPPAKPFLVDGKVAGNWGYERGLSYHHFLKAGHEVPSDQPAAAFVFVRDFVVGRHGYKDHPTEEARRAKSRSSRAAGETSM